MATTMTQKVKENPIKSTLAIIVSLTSIIIFIFKVDDRYAKADTLDDINKAIKVQKVDIVNDLKREQYIMQIENIEDTIFEIDIRHESGQALPSDTAVKERHIRKIDRLNSKIGSLK